MLLTKDLPKNWSVLLLRSPSFKYFIQKILPENCNEFNGQYLSSMVLSKNSLLSTDENKTSSVNNTFEKEIIVRDPSKLPILVSDVKLCKLCMASALNDASVNFYYCDVRCALKLSPWGQFPRRWNPIHAQFLDGSSFIVSLLQPH